MNPVCVDWLFFVYMQYPDKFHSAFEN